MNSIEVGKELVKAAERGDAGKAQRCLRQTDINTQQMSQALVFAAKGGHVEIVKILIKEGANLNLPDKSGWAPLHAATFKRHSEIVLMLVSAGAKINVVDKEGNTPLHCAARDSAHNVVRTLLDLGADKNARNNNHRLPIELTDDTSIVDLLGDPVIEEEEIPVDNPKEGLYALPLEDHRLQIVYSTIKHNLNGKVRNKHIPEIMTQLGIPFDKKRLSKSFWDNHGEFYINNVRQLSEFIETLRTDKDVKVDPLAELFRYELPQWLREEFKASEILLYEHHFSLIDIDNGGSIDASELQALIVNFGSKISLEDAQSMLDEYDMDGGGTIDFVEFMVLVYKIQRGTIDLTTSDLAQALTEAKSQLKIFEEIEDISRDLPAFCSVSHFGGTPVSCNFIIRGPPGTPYEGSEITLQMVFYDGYPYIQPEIQFIGRVMGLHVLPQLGGDARLMHVKDIWTSEWSMRTLLDHTVDVLSRPDCELLPDKLYVIYKAWEAALRHKMSSVEQSLAGRVRAEEMRQRVESEMKARSGHNSAHGSRQGSVQNTPRAVAEAKGTGDSNHNSSDMVMCKGTSSSHPSTHNSRHPSAQNTPRILAMSPHMNRNTAVLSKHSTPRSDSKDPEPAPPTQDVPQNQASFEEKVAVERQKVQSALTMDDVSTPETRTKILALSRIERMHLGVMFVYLTDRAQYHETVKAFMQQQKPRVDHK